MKCPRVATRADMMSFKIIPPPYCTYSRDVRSKLEVLFPVGVAFGSGVRHQAYRVNPWATILSITITHELPREQSYVGGLSHCATAHTETL